MFVFEESMEKEVTRDSSGFDHVAALNKAGFAVRVVKKFRKGWPAFDLGNEQSVQQQAVLMAMLEQPKTVIPPIDPVVRVERRERERQRLTAALDLVLNTVSPYRSTVMRKPLRNERNEIPQVENDAEVRVALRELFANPEPIKTQASLLQRMLQYRIEFVPPWHSLFQRDDRRNIISQLKEVYK